MENHLTNPQTCDACGQTLDRETNAPTSGGLDGPRNEAYVTLGGGYASFVDNVHQPDWAPYQFVFCEACAVRLCREFHLDAVLREHHTSTVCLCSDRPARGFPLPCACAVCQAPQSGAGAPSSFQAGGA